MYKISGRSVFSVYCISARRVLVLTINAIIISSLCSTFMIVFRSPVETYVWHLLLSFATLGVSSTFETAAVGHNLILSQWLLGRRVLEDFWEDSEECSNVPVCLSLSYTLFLQSRQRT